MQKAIKVSTIAAFALFICAPFLHERLHFIKYRPLSENRLKKQRPTDWPSLFQSGSPFAKRYEDYFNDNYGLRDLFIRTKNQLDYALFRQSEKVIVGRDHWLFYKSVVEAEQIGAERISAENMRKIFERLLALNRTLASRGITLVVLPCPMKSTIYPEMLPRGVPRRPNPTAFNRYRKFLSDHPEIVTIDPTPLLMSLKSSLQVYYRTDFHWTDPAGAEVAKALVNKLGQLSGKGNLWNQPIKIQMEEQKFGGENQALGLLRPFREIAPYLDPEIMESKSGEYTNTQESNEWTYRTKLGNTDALIPDTVMFGDSFADAFLRAGFTAYFARFQKFYNWQFRDKYHSIPPGTRFLVFQHIEVILNGLENPAMWPEELWTQP